MDVMVSNYLYQPSIIIEIAILLAIIVCLPKPHYLTALMAGLLLVRPNERFDCIVSYPKIILPLLAVSLIFFSDKESRLQQFKNDKPLLCFIVVIVIETLLFHREDISGNLAFITVGLLLYYAVLIFTKDIYRSKPLSYAILFSCLLICGEAVYYHYTEPMGSVIWTIFHTHTVDLELGRLQAWGNWGNANETAFIACIGVSNTVLLCARYRSKLFSIAAAGIVPFFCLVIFLTASRAGFASLLLIFLPMLFFLNSKFVKVTLLFGVLAAILLSSSYSPQRKDSESSSEDRFDLRYKGVQLFKQYPLFGVGFQRAGYNTGGQPLHNTYLQALAETGLFGAPFLFFFIYRMCARLYRAMIFNKNNNYSNTNVATVMGQLLSPLFYFLWGNQLLTIMFFICLAQVNTGIQLIENERLVIPPE